MWGTSSYSQVALIPLLFVTFASVMVPVSQLHVLTTVQEDIPAASLCAYGRFALTCLSPLPRQIYCSDERVSGIGLIILHTKGDIGLESARVAWQLQKTSWNHGKQAPDPAANIEFLTVSQLSTDILEYSPQKTRQSPYELSVTTIPPVFRKKVSQIIKAILPSHANFDLMTLPSAIYIAICLYGESSHTAGTSKRDPILPNTAEHCCCMLLSSCLHECAFLCKLTPPNLNVLNYACRLTSAAGCGLRTLKVGDAARRWRARCTYGWALAWALWPRRLPSANSVRSITICQKWWTGTPMLIAIPDEK